MESASMANYAIGSGNARICERRNSTWRWNILKLKFRANKKLAEYFIVIENQIPPSVFKAKLKGGCRVRASAQLFLISRKPPIQCKSTPGNNTFLNSVYCGRCPLWYDRSVDRKDCRFMNYLQYVFKEENRSVGFRRRGSKTTIKVLLNSISRNLTRRI